MDRTGTFYRVETEENFGKDNEPKVGGYLAGQINMLKVMTMWPLDEPNRLVNICYRSIMLTRFLLLISASVGQSVQILSSPDLNGMTSAVDIVTMTASAGYKMMFLPVFYGRYRKLMKVVDEEFIERSPIYRETGGGNRRAGTEMRTVNMREWMKYSGFSVYGYVSVGFCSLLIWVITPLFTMTDYDFQSLDNATRDRRFGDYGKILPLNARPPFGAIRSPSYEILYVAEAVAVLDSVMVYLTTDVFLFCTVYTVCGQLEIVKNTLRNIKHILGSNKVVRVNRENGSGPSAKNRYFCYAEDPRDLMNTYRMDEPESDAIFERTAVSRRKSIEESIEMESVLNDVLIDCINHHQILLKFLRDLEQLSQTVIIVDCLHAIISLSFALFQTSESDNMVEYIKTTVFFGICVFHQFLNNFFGEYIIQQQLAIREAAYDLPWVDRHPKFKNLMRVMIMRAQTPVVLNGMKMYFLCYKTFMEFIKLLISYFMVLRQLQDDNK